MSVGIANNRKNLAAFRATLNTWASAINTLITGLAAVVTDITTIEGDITALQSSKQDAAALSTLNFAYTNSVSIDYTLTAGDVNKVFDITNAGATSFTFPPTGTISAFRVGCVVYVYNNSGSSNNITLTAGGGVTLLQGPGVTLTPGQCATVMRIGTSRYLRLY